VQLRRCQKRAITDQSLVHQQRLFILGILLLSQRSCLVSLRFLRLFLCDESADNLLVCLHAHEQLTDESLGIDETSTAEDDRDAAGRGLRGEASDEREGRHGQRLAQPIGIGMLDVTRPRHEILLEEIDNRFVAQRLPHEQFGVVVGRTVQVDEHQLSSILCILDRVGIRTSVPMRGVRSILIGEFLKELLLRSEGTGARPWP